MFYMFYLFNTNIEDEDGGIEENSKGSNYDEVDSADTVHLEIENTLRRMYTQCL